MSKAPIFALISAIASAQAPSPTPQIGSISGVVTTTAGEPVRGATLRLFVQREATVQVAYSVFSDAKGHFTFEDMEAGSFYGVCSDKPGYLYTCHTDSAKRQTFTLAAGQMLTGMDIKAAPQALISGRVTDENGDPYPNVRVETARWEYRKGQKQLQADGGRGAVSNVEGEFSIGGLEAGSYYILVEPRPTSIQNLIHKGPQETYLTTYYPGVTDPSKAIAVQVPAGGAVRGIEIRTLKTRAYRVRGKLVAAAGGVLTPSTSVRLVPEDGPLLAPAASIVRDGVFDFEGVLPGGYFLEVRASTSGQAWQRVSVGNADVDDVIVQLAPWLEVTGTIAIDGAALPLQPKPVVHLTVAARVGCCGAEQASENGTFAFHNVMPGRYLVGAETLPPGTYVKSVRLGDRDVTKTAFDLTAGDAATLHIVLSPNAGDIAAVAHDPDGLPHPGVNMSLWTPGIPAEGAPDFTRLSYAGVNGQFKFTNLPPGDYRIAAWQEDDFYRSMEPQLRVKLENRAAAVHLDENQHLTVEVPIIGRDVVDAEAAKLQ
jgi:hypothetical protein